MNGFAFDTGDRYPEIERVSRDVDETMRVRFYSVARARNVFNKLKANIEAHEDVDALDQYMRDESVVIDGLHLFDPFVAAEVDEIYQAHRACLVHGGHDDF